MDSISQKVAFLIEMFEDLPIDFIENVVHQYSNATLQQLVDKCLKQNEEQESKQNTIDNDNQTEFTEMISLIPAFTTSYFSNNNNNKNRLTHSALNTMPKQYQEFFEPYLNHKDIPKIMDIYTHLSLMTEQYKLQYNNHQYSNYNESKIKQLNACILMIHKLMQNIYKSPNIDKYRCVRESNNAFKKKIGHIEGSKLLLSLCGWDYIDAIYIFNSALNLEWIQIVSQFLTFYVEHEIHKTNKMDDEYPIITHFPRKKLKPKNEKMGKQITKKAPKINTLSNQELREKRIKNLGNINDKNYGLVSNQNADIIGPIPDKIMDLNAPNLRNELKEIAKKKHKKWINSRKARKRIFTMNDIEQLRKQEFEEKAKGPKVSNALDQIGKEALSLTNEFRKQNGLSELKWHQDLCDIGKVHSKNMAEGKVPFSHQGFNDRVREYPFRALSAAENVAMSRGLSNVARVAVDGWIDSPGHRKNLLSNHNYCGIGVYRGYNGAYYLTQLFGLTNI